VGVCETATLPTPIAAASAASEHHRSLVTLDAALDLSIAAFTAVTW
jgi:hypothetical protein